ncbi:MAG TPA: hypothetical protein VF764_12530 [Steroidobacteraceae bacterium]
MKKPRQPQFEWLDPITGEIHQCPRAYMAVRHFLGRGERNALHANLLLAHLGVPRTESNRRHLRKAIYILQAMGLPAVSTRSRIGGYYYAITWEEIDQHCSIQEKLAESMLARAKLLRDIWRHPDPPYEGDLFDDDRPPA